MHDSYGVSPNIYNGAAVVINDRPFINYYLQQQAHKRARDEALDNYYRDQIKSVTPTGMRAKDIEGGWSQKVNEWQQLGVQGKQYLMNPALDNYKTLNEFNRLKNELHSDVARSKEAAENEDALRKARMSGTWNPTDNDIVIANDNSKSIYDKTRQGMTLDQLSVNRPAFDNVKFLKEATGGAERGTIQDAPIIDATKGLQTINSRQEYSPQQVKNFADNAASLATQPGSYRDYFEHQLHSENLPTLQAVYKNLYPNGGIVDTPEKAAQAYVALQASTPTGHAVKTEKYVDPNAELSRQMQMEGVRDRHEKENIRLRKSLGVDGAREFGDSGGMDQFMSDQFEKAKSNPRTYTTADGQSSTQYSIPASAASKKIFAVKVQEATDNGTKQVEKTPDELRFNADGTYITPIFYNGKIQPGEGRKVAVDETLSKPVSVDEVKIRWGKDLLGVKANAKNVGSGGFLPKKPVKLQKGAFDNL